MIKNKLTRKTIAIFFVLNFLSTILPYNELYAQSTPNAPEAAAFEPVDATDMVDLLTGDLTYVLPLLNVPSPEGGYPVALNYHAGVAMDQEASWVGLGWNLNPGSINRGVNGYPDDWDETIVDEFFYDNGWVENYYSFGIGATFSGSLSLGLGFSWGSNKSLSGHVSIGLGVGGTSLGVTLGNEVASLGLGMKGFQVSAGTNGIGIGYGFTPKGSSASLGFSLNYSPNSGLSGGFDVSTKTGEYSNGKSKMSSLGINFSSSGVSLNGKVNGSGMGIYNNTKNLSLSDYDIKVNSSGFTLPLIVFHISFSHKKVRYSLYKHNSVETSGILYPIEANRLRPYHNSNKLSRSLFENSFMDVNVLTKYDTRKTSYDDLSNKDYRSITNNLVLPSYDNYSVTAQGLSGSLNPYFHTELNLSARGNGEQSGSDNFYVSYLNHSKEEYYSSLESGLDVNRYATRKINFTLNNAYNSFLRYDRGDFFISSYGGNPTLPHANNDGYTLANFKTSRGKYRNRNSLNNRQRKREGHNIRTYTNKEIRESFSNRGISNLPNFKEAKGINRANKKVFQDNGLGAYSITTPDGKTYHYSLPVYNFESYYKNFKNRYNENKNFFEIKKTKPYATHWLLTAITGPDYVDDGDGKISKNDLGYWVEFEYGKWSDGYLWRTPNGRYEEHEDEEGNKTYSYSWGRKQLYYLDAIRTRTHTALFVKDLRKDAVSPRKNHYVKKWSRKMNERPQGKEVKNVKTSFINKMGTYYSFSGELKSLKEKCSYYISGKKANSKYIEVPEMYSLRLSKIILLPNKSLSSYSKTKGNIMRSGTGVIYVDNYYSTIRGNAFNHSNNSYIDDSPNSGSTSCGGFYIDALYTKKPNDIEIFKVNSHENILDVKDIENLNLESKAKQVIEFSHSYTLGKGTPGSITSNKARLTLNSLLYKGKKGIQVTPPYSFDYISYGSYNKDNIDDWGYNKNNPAIWSLNKIKTPTGGSINITYESDSYSKEAAFREEKEFKFDVSKDKVTRSGSKIKFILNGSSSLQNYFRVGNYYDLDYTHYLTTSEMDNNYIPRKIYYTTSRISKDLHLVSGVGNNWVEFDLKDNNHNLLKSKFIEDNYSTNEGNHVKKFNLTGFVYSPKSKKGGGIRTKSVSVSNGVKNIISTKYEYSKGITSYAPSNKAKAIPYSSELPPPLVMYDKVTMKNYDGNNKFLGGMEYNFNTLTPFYESKNPNYMFSLGNAFGVKEEQSKKFFKGKLIANKYTIYNNLSSIGKLKSVKTFNSLMQNMQIQKSNYKPISDREGEIGVTQETYKSVKRVFKQGNHSVFILNHKKIPRLDTKHKTSFYYSSTSKVNYPSVLESVEQTSGGLTVIKHFDKHDFLTGQVLETRTYASNGKAFKTKMVPAYKITAYSKMGSKVDNIKNKNMLSQAAAEYSYVYKNNSWQPIGVGMTTWKNNWIYKFNNNTTKSTNDVWRKHRTYTWNGDVNEDGTYRGFRDDFNWSVSANQNSKWKKLSEVTRYNQFSQPLEVIDINDNYASTKMGDDYSKVIATSNANYDEMYYSGAEHIAKESSAYFDGGVKSAGRKLLRGQAHTGDYVVEVGPRGNAFEVAIPARSTRLSSSEFKVSVWVKKGQEVNARIKVNGAIKSFTPSESVTAGNWVLLNGYVDVSSSATKVAITSARGTIQLDDFRLHPVASSMTSYVYNKWDEVSYIIAPNGLYTHYKYDDAGRLKEVWQEVVNAPSVNITDGERKVKEYKYTYKKFVEMDTNGNGQIDTAELYPPLGLSAWISRTNNSYKIKAYPSGGSGDFEYSFAISSSPNPTNFSSWVKNKEYSVYFSCGQKKYYKCRVKDNTIGKVIEYSGEYTRSCGSGPGGPDEIREQK